MRKTIFKSTEKKHPQLLLCLWTLEARCNAKKKRIGYSWLQNVTVHFILSVSAIYVCWYSESNNKKNWTIQNGFMSFFWYETKKKNMWIFMLNIRLAVRRTCTVHTYIKTHCTETILCDSNKLYWDKNFGNLICIRQTHER